MQGSLSGRSKPLGHPDDSGFYFMQEIMAGEPGGGINFDCLLKHPKQGYLLFELLLCEEQQTVTPWTSHPNRYWYKNKQKFLSLWAAAQSIGGTLILVNYAKKGTAHENEILMMIVERCDLSGIKTRDFRTTREQFAEYFRQLNRDILKKG